LFFPAHLSFHLRLLLPAVELKEYQLDPGELVPRLNPGFPALVSPINEFSQRQVWFFEEKKGKT